MTTQSRLATLISSALLAFGALQPSSNVGALADASSLQHHGNAEAHRRLMRATSAL
jgi:hypothetical protein